MFYKLKKDCFVRSFDNYGYITSSGFYKDQIFDINGQLFLNLLSRKPTEFQFMVDNLVKKFTDVKREILEKDLLEFLSQLNENGFISCGKTEKECNDNDKFFSYNSLENNNSIIKKNEDIISSQLLLEEIFKKNPRIVDFQIELTSKCNERCVHCYIPHELKLFNIEEKLYYKVLDELTKMGTLNLTLSGGEAMTHPKFKEFLKAAKERDFNVSVLSNLTLLDDEIVDILKSGNVSSVQVSLYSMDPEHHDLITRVKGSHEKTMNSINKLIENNIPIQVSTVLMNQNMNDFIDIYNFCKSKKIRLTVDYSIMAKINHDISNLENRINPRNCKKIIFEILNSDKETEEFYISKNTEDFFTNYNFDRDDIFCGVGISKCCMVANGNVYPCAGWQSMVCGNLNIDTLENIWKNSPQLKELRKLTSKDIKKCLYCKNRNICVPCLARFSNESPSGNYKEVATHFCEVTKYKKEAILSTLRRNNIKNKKVSNLNEYIDLINYINNSLSKGGPESEDFYYNKIVFRGVSNIGYELIPSICRISDSNYSQSYEYFTCINAIKSSPDIFDGKNNIDKVCIMQHFGVPTRLIDFTFNPLVALYFACQDNENDGYIFYTSIAYDENIKLCKIFDSIFNKEQIDVEEYRKIVSDLDVDLSSLFYIPKKYYERENKQDSVFLVVPNIIENGQIKWNKLKYFENFNYNNTNLPFKGIIIPKEHKKQLLNELSMLNINEYSLFDDLSSLGNDCIKFLKK